ncbi:MAG: crossover junction endodeoxyribonuclease RuvC [Candidatus Levybacteria bacterium RIFCSPHIGHO2_02_FULL_37_10]|nr:MAG: crossover junction endodeoxyribonuclease RuvC [Candidatus Levybacteria bacterium RIFCSPHIGHO2_02_FULL_37_10]
MIILGIDPGIARCGWGVIQIQNSTLRLRSGQEFKIQNYGCIETKAEIAVEKRLKIIYDKIVKIIKDYNPDVLAIEELFFTNNAKTAFKVGEARGAIILAGAMQKIPVFSYTPLQVKIAVTGYGNADKVQVGRMIKAILKLKEMPKPDDAADALAVALTRAFAKKF